MTADSAPRAAGWTMTEHGERLHAYSALAQAALCGLRRPSWYPPDAHAPLCKECGESYGPSFPAPPGRPHRVIAARARALGQTLAPIQTKSSEQTIARAPAIRARPDGARAAAA